MSQALDFFLALYGGEEELETGYLIITNLNGQNLFFKNLRKAAEAAEELSKTGNVYFGTGLYDTVQKGAHGHEKNICVRGFYCVDIDIYGPNHKKKNLPKNALEATTILNKALGGIKPTAIVKTGGGYHYYYAFKEPWVFEDEEDRKRCKEFSTMFHRILLYDFRAKGYDLDNVANLNRMLRVPGTFNHKNEEKTPVTLEFLEPLNQINEDIVKELYVEDNMSEAREKELGIVEGENPFGLVVDPRAQPPAEKFYALMSTHILFKGSWECRQDMRGNKDKSMSSFDQSLANIAKNSGWTDQEIANLLINHRQTMGKTEAEKRKGLRLGYLTSTIKASYDKLEKNMKIQALSDNMDSVAERIASIDKPMGEISDSNLEVKREELNERKLAIEESLKNISDVIGVSITSVRKYCCGSEEPTYEITANGKECLIGHVNKLFSFAHVTQQIATLTDRVVKNITKKEWPTIVDGLLICSETIEVGQGLSDLDVTRERIIMYLSEKTIYGIEEKDKCAEHMNPFRDEKGQVYMFMAGFRAWLSQKNDKFEAGKLSRSMSKLGHVAVTMNFTVDKRRTTRHVYRINDNEL